MSTWVAGGFEKARIGAAEGEGGEERVRALLLGGQG